MCCVKPICWDWSVGSSDTVRIWMDEIAFLNFGQVELRSEGVSQESNPTSDAE